MVKNLPGNPGDTGDASSIPGSGRSPGGGHGNPHPYPCLENPMNKGAWKIMVHRGANSWTLLQWLSTFTHASFSLVPFLLPVGQLFQSSLLLSRFTFGARPWCSHSNLSIFFFQWGNNCLSKLTMKRLFFFIFVLPVSSCYLVMKGFKMSLPKMCHFGMWVNLRWNQSKSKR